MLFIKTKPAASVSLRLCDTMPLPVGSDPGFAGGGRSGIGFGRIFHRRSIPGISILIWLGMSLILFADADDEVTPSKGFKLFQSHCASCHQPTGLGVPGVFPPVADSDFVAANRDQAILAVLDGMKGKVTVNGIEYNNAMPPVALSDRDVADVMTYVFSELNSLPAVTIGQVQELRATTTYPTYAALVASMYNKPLPAPPKGYDIRVLADLEQSPVRMVSLDDDRLLVLMRSGNVVAINKQTGSQQPFLNSTDYLQGNPELTDALGMCLDSSRRLFILANHSEIANKVPLRHITTIYRSEPIPAGGAMGAHPKPWFKTARVPAGSEVYNHSPACIVEGPDGFLYVGSGSRSDAGEPNGLPGAPALDERGMSSSIWRISRDEPMFFEIFAQGFRNPFGLCFGDGGQLYVTDNGPDKEAPEELNRIKWGRHYGFPYQFGDLAQNPYPNAPKAPSGLSMELPMQNLGPAGLGVRGSSDSSFAAHSCPVGMTWLDASFPDEWANGLLVARFGNFLKVESGDVGFDILHVRPLPENGGRSRFECTNFLLGVARPIDVKTGTAGDIYVAEYSRATSSSEGLGLPGRILVLRPTNSSVKVDR